MPSYLDRARAIHDAAQAVPAGSITLAQFVRSGRAVVIYSDVLECELVLAADNARVPEGETRPIYRARELTGLDAWTPDGLRLLHEVKTRFGGEVMDDNTSTT